MARRRFLVSTAAVQREIRKAAKQLRKMRKGASRAKGRAIELHLKVLKHCFRKLGNIRPI